MKIGFVLHPYGEEKPAGLGKATYEIARSLIAHDPGNEYVVFLRCRPKVMPQFPGKNWRLRVVETPVLWLEVAVVLEKPALCIFNTPVMPLFVRPTRAVVIAYDFAFMEFNRHPLLAFYQGRALRRADRIVTISKFTAQEVTRLFGISPRKIETVYLGFEPMTEDVAPPPFAVPQHFFFFAGVFKERKNVHGVLEAFRLFKIRYHLPHKLIIAGWGDRLYVERLEAFISTHHLRDEVMIRGDVFGKKLAYFYRRAEALLYPSFIEGFGFPVLEAMSAGCPVITSTTSSLPEVAGNAALLVDPARPEEIAEAMRRISTEPPLRAQLVGRGFAQSKNFSWEKCGRAYADLVRRILP